jgi:hypothetical protein
MVGRTVNYRPVSSAMTGKSPIPQLSPDPRSLSPLSAMTSSAPPPLSPLSAMLPAVFAALDDNPESAAFGDTSSESSRTPPPGVPTSPPTPPQKTVTRRRGKAAVDPTAKALRRARRSEIERNSRLRRLVCACVWTRRFKRGWFSLTVFSYRMSLRACAKTCCGSSTSTSA